MDVYHQTVMALLMVAQIELAARSTFAAVTGPEMRRLISDIEMDHMKGCVEKIEQMLHKGPIIRTDN